MAETPRRTRALGASECVEISAAWRGAVMYLKVATASDLRTYPPREIGGGGGRGTDDAYEDVLDAAGIVALSQFTSLSDTLVI